MKTDSFSLVCHTVRVIQQAGTTAGIDSIKRHVFIVVVVSVAIINKQSAMA